MSFRLDPRTLTRWNDMPGGRLLVPAGDCFAASQRLSPSLDDDASSGLLRSSMLALADGSDLSRYDGHMLVDQLAAALADGRLRDGRDPAALKLLRLVPVAAPAPAPPPPAPAPSPRPQAASLAPAPVETTFGSDLDVAAMVAVLVQAAQDGVPFCEECARAAAAQAAGQPVAA
jgi:hypothetical protein